MKDQKNIHEVAAKGFQIAGDAYERGRPEYPTDATDHLIRALDITKASTVIDVGAGTGKLTKVLARSCNNLIAVEPVEGMRRKFSSLLPQLQVLEGSAENLPLATASADAIVVAQAFHWFNGSLALQEFHRVLKPEGKIGLIWNARDESLDWVSKLTEIIDPHESGAPRYKSGLWRQAFTQTKYFSSLQIQHFKYIQCGTYDTIVDRIGSISFISSLPEDVRSEVLGEVRQLLATHPQTASKVDVELPYRTDVFWCSKANM
jgi:ubiquinone/menaquinone biosynthesis C-methylase UbiE